MDLMTLVAKLTLDSSEYEEGLEDAEKKGGGFGSAVKMAAGGVAAGMTAVVGATSAVSAAFIKGAGGAAEYGDNIDKMSQKMGLSAEKYQEWDAILQHSGSSIEAMKSSMKTLATAAETGSDAFEKLGISQEQLSQMSQEELFEATISALQNVEDTTERTYLAGKTLGRGATELGALLNTSAEETEAMRQRVHELGGVMSDEAVKSAAQYQDSLQDMTTAFEGVKRNLMSSFLPSITTVMDGLGNLFSGDSNKGLGQIKEGVSKFISNLSKAIPKVIEIGKTIVSALGQAIIENLPTILEAGVNAILELAKGIGQALPTLIPAMVDAILTMVEGLLDNIDQIIDAGFQLMVGLAEGIINALPRIIEKIPVIITKLVEALINSIPKIIEAGVKLLSSLVQNLPTIIANVVQAIPQIISSIAGAIVNGVPSIIDAGINLISGLGKGIIDGAVGVIESAKRVAGNVLDSIKGFFGIKSPSKVMAQYGKFLDEGLALGIANNMNIPEKAMGNLSDKLADSFAPEIGVNTPDKYAGAAAVLNTPTSLLTGDSGRDLYVTLELNGDTLGRTVYRLYNEQNQKVGVKLAGGVA